MREAMMSVYAPPEVVFTHGQGAELFTDDGHTYLDFISGIAVNALGHAHPHLVKALSDQATQLWHLSNMFRIPQAERLAERLCESTFADRVFFANSGAEANECGLKMMRRYQFDQGRVERTRIIGMHQSFHGRTIATVCAAGNPSYTQGFVPDDQGFDHIPFGDISALRAAITEQTAGIILEPVQGEGGVRVADSGFLKAVRALCDEHDLLLMFDEVQCGVARSGQLYAYQALGVCPDILASAKGLGGGFPLGACLASNKAAACMVVGTHGSTFGGNPLAAAVGNAVLDVVNDSVFLQTVSAQSEYFLEGLRRLSLAHPDVYGSPTGLGLMLGLGLVNKAENTHLVTHLRDKHRILVGKAGGNTLRFLPPLIVSRPQIDQVLSALDESAQHCG